MFHPRLHGDLFAHYEPSLLVTTSPGWFLADAVMLREAKREGVPSVAAVLAWDNPTSKGYRGATPKAVVAWSSRMAEQLRAHHDLSPERVFIGGVPQFDLYARTDGFPSRDTVFSELGLDPDRRLIFFTCRSPSTYSHNQTVAAVLASAIASHALAAPAQLIVRLHPISFRADHRSPLDEYISLAGRFDHVRIDVPAISSKRLSCDVPEADFQRLAALLMHCDVLVNAFSTTTLEAFCLDKPVILVSDEAHRTAGLSDESPEGRDFHLDAHMETVVGAGAARVARNFEELVMHVNSYLCDARLDSLARARVMAQECGPIDGQAGTRVGEFLIDQLATTGRGPDRLSASRPTWPTLEDDAATPLSSIRMERERTT